MTAQLLTSELSTLLQESKRKNPELRSAAEKSLNDLKALPRTSESQIAADLKSRPFFVHPFLIACSSRNAKFAGSAVICLQRLVVARALPQEALPGVLDALKDCSTLALDIQLKVLQAIPSLLQNYAINLTGQLLTTTVQICFVLYSSKNAVVCNAAAATLQQLMNATFETAGAADADAGADESPFEAPIGEGSVTIWGPALDAYRLFEDLCLMTEGQKPKHLDGGHIVQNFGLELLESIMTSHSETVTAHPELIHLLRAHTMPLIIKILAEKTPFAVAVRAMRLLQLILGRLLFALAEECETALTLLNHMLDADAAVLWKRTLCLELFRNLHAEPALLRNMYAYYDEDSNNRNIIRDHLGSLVRLASERPNVIGLGQQSSVPVLQKDDSGEQAAMQAGGFVGTIGVSMNTVDLNTPGISNRWSTIRTPCIDMLDKNEPPPLPATYIYSLALTCATTFSDGLARFLLPFTVPAEVRSKRRHTRSSHSDKQSSSNESEAAMQQIRKIPTNPLSLEDHVLYSQISTSAHMVDQCWPALLAASSTFLNASMDSEHYHALIRSFQKFTQIAGILDLRTPRDAFLTTLGKHAVPSNTSSKASKNQSSAIQSSHQETPGRSTSEVEGEGGLLALNTRHLLCLRALINLGIALGPFLQKSWSIILETLQQADLVANALRSGQSRNPGLARRKSDFSSGADDGDQSGDLALEITAAETAASRMFESTNELPPNSFLDLLQCICILLQHDVVPETPTSSGLLSPDSGFRKHQKLRSISGTSLETSAADRETMFILEKLDQMIQHNVVRLMQLNSQESGWDLLLNQLKNLISSQSASSDVRMKAASTLHDMIVLASTSDLPESVPGIDHLRARSLEAIVAEISILGRTDVDKAKGAIQCEMEIHAQTLDAARVILEKSGEALNTGWSNVFAIVNSVFERVGTVRRPKSVKLARSSFGSLELICSDFLSSVPSNDLLLLLDTLMAFSTQDLDLNVSLTTATLFRNISDYLVRDKDTLSLDPWKTSSSFDERSALSGADKSGSASTNALWICLLLRLVELSVDARQEVRHSVLRTVFGILGASHGFLPDTSRLVCFRLILLPLIIANEKAYASSDAEPAREESWNQSAVLVIEGVCKVFSQWLEKPSVFKDAGTILEMLLTSFEGHWRRRNLNVCRAIFSGLAGLFSEVQASGILSTVLRARCWETWRDHNPAMIARSSANGHDNQEALMEYINCLDQLLHLIREELQVGQIKDTLTELRHTIVESTSQMYSSDVDVMTNVQRAVTETLQSIPTALPDAMFCLLDCISDLINLSYRRTREKEGSSLTFLALSKSSMSLLESFVEHHHQTLDGVDAQRLLTSALQALHLPMRLKYHCSPEGRAPSPWRKATSTTVTLVEKCEKSVINNADSQSPLWRTIADTIDCVIAADVDACEDESTIEADQDADIEAFLVMRRVLKRSSGHPGGDEVPPKTYVQSVFKHSLLHEPHPDDLAPPGKGILLGLDSDHIGRVQDLPLSPRSKLGYLLLDELFDLAAGHDQVVSRGNMNGRVLADEVEDHLILRAGLTLKAYVKDQPLRGLMPQPWSQKEELLYVLKKLAQLNSRPRNHKYVDRESALLRKTHLHRLYPLMMPALRVAGRDRDTENAIQEAFEAMGSSCKSFQF